MRLRPTPANIAASVAWIWVWAWLALAGTPAWAAPGDRAQAQHELDQITAELNDLDRWFSRAKTKRERFQGDIRDADTEIAEVSRQIRGLETSLATTRTEVAALTTQQAALETQRRGQAEKIARHIRSASRLTGQDFFKLLLNMESPERFERMLRYHRTFSSARLNTLAAYQSTLTEIASTQARLAEQQTRLERQRTGLAGRERELAASRSERAALLDDLLAEAETREAERERLSADRGRLGDLIAQLKQRANRLDGKEFAAARGDLPWPTDGQVRYRFGQDRAAGKLEWHGMVIGANEGTAVRAVHRGKVIFADWLRGFGLLTIVNHGDEYMTLYAHLDSITKAPGDWVESGEAIATAGRSGGVAEPGLYFEVRHHGKPENPRPWLQSQ